MPLEAASFIDDLNPSNPVASDGMGQGDDHIRLIKSALTNTFTAMDAATGVTPETLDALEAGELAFADGTATAPKLRSGTEATLGLYRVAAGKLGLSQGKRLVGNGTVPVGSLHHFPKLPTAGTYTTSGTATANPERIEYIECDGSTYNVADFPDLGAYLGSTFGGNGVSTFAVPNEKDTGRFRRSRDGSTTLGAYHTNQNKAHTHSATTSSDGAHTHTINITDPGHKHNVYYTSANLGGGGGSGIAQAVGDSGHNQEGSDGAKSNTTGITAASVSNGAHTHTVTTDSNGGTEARPEAFVCFACVKT